MKIKFKEVRLRSAALAIIEEANKIIEEYQRQDLRLTLRQLFYCFVSRDLIANNVKEYGRLGDIISDGRLAGLIDWDAIEDRGRNAIHPSRWDDPPHILQQCAQAYQIDLWAGQPCRPEVWVEKEALIGVLIPVCRRLRVSCFACKGYTSLSEMFSAGYERFRGAAARAAIIHLGDHDPSGIDMTRDIRERLSLFAGEEIEVRRIALNFDQIEEYNPPPNPAKSTDSRFASYQREFGNSSWELDALEPRLLSQLIEDNVTSYRVDARAWNSNVEREQRERDELYKLSVDYAAVAKFLMERKGG